MRRTGRVGRNVGEMGNIGESEDMWRSWGHVEPGWWKCGEPENVREFEEM